MGTVENLSAPPLNSVEGRERKRFRLLSYMAGFTDFY
jgi:hypothetical protein